MVLIFCRPTWLRLLHSFSPVMINIFYHSSNETTNDGWVGYFRSHAGLVPLPRGIKDVNWNALALFGVEHVIYFVALNWKPPPGHGNVHGMLVYSQNFPCKERTWIFKPKVQLMRIHHILLLIMSLMTPNYWVECFPTYLVLFLFSFFRSLYSIFITCCYICFLNLFDLTNFITLRACEVKFLWN